jgi:outer membrane protein assembly factor BamB
VLEVDRDGNTVWSFGSGDPKDCSPTDGHILGLNDAERLAGGVTLMAGTGTPGCPDNRVIAVSGSGRTIWQYGQGGKSGSGPNLLNTPVFAIQLPDHNFLITDQGNNRIIEVDKYAKTIDWSYGPTSGPGALNSPNSAELLPNQHILIADENNNRVIEIDRAGRILWEYNQGLNGAAFASRLPNGDTLITDSGNSRIIEVTPGKKIVFEYKTNTQPGSNPMPLPTNAVQLSNGNISIADQFNHRVMIIDRNKHILFQYGMLNKPGNGPNQLNGPYTSFVLGDYTGQTPPPSFF